jgi:hypothetical protein
VDHRKFTAGIENLEFEIESEVPFSPATPKAQKAKPYYIANPTSCVVEYGLMWVNICCQQQVTAVIVQTTDRPLSLATLRPDSQNLPSVHQTQGTH